MTADWWKLQFLVKRGENYTPVKAIQCVDGFSMSVQAGEGIYCRGPEGYRSAVGPWTHMEVGFPSEVEDLLTHWAEDDCDLTDTVYPCVPVEIILEVIEKHGGFAGAYQ